MDIISLKYNKKLILFITISPLLSYFFDIIIGISLQSIIILLSFLGIALFLVFNTKKRQIRSPPYLVFLLLFTLYRFFMAFILLGNDFKIKYIYSNSFIGAIFLIFIIENMSISTKYYNQIFIISKNILIIAFLVILYQELFDVDFLRFQYKEIDPNLFLEKSELRLKSIYGYLGYNSFGLIYLPILLWVIESLNKNNSNVMVWIFMGVIYVFLSKARWLMVNSITIFFVLIVHSKHKITESLKYVMLLFLLISIGFFGLNLIGINTNEIVEKRIFETDKDNISQTSAGTRLFAFEAFSKVFWDQPFLGAGNHKYGMGGTGKHNYKLRSILGDKTAQIHVGYLSLFYKFGLVGGFLWMAFLFSLLKKLYITGKIKNVWAPFFGVMGFALVNLTQVSLSFMEIGLIIALFVNRYYSQKPEYLKN